MMNSCKTKKKFEYFVEIMGTQHYRHVSKNGVYRIIAQQKVIISLEK